VGLIIIAMPVISMVGVVMIMMVVMIMRLVVVGPVVMVFVMIMLFVMIMTFVRVIFVTMRLEVMMAGLSAVLLVLEGLDGLRRIEALRPDHLALDALAMAAPAGVAVTGTAAMAGAVLALFLRLAMGAFLGLDQRLTVGDRDLVIVGMDFAEGQKTVAVATIFDEGRLQRRLYARDLGEVDITAQLPAVGGLEIKFLDAIAADHDNPGLFRVGGIDQHLVGHFGALDGGGRGAWRAQIAPPGDATVHLIRG
jgi:hypothetical protein